MPQEINAPNADAIENNLPNTNEPIIENEPQVVSRDAYENVKKDMLKFKQQTAEFQKRLDDMKINGHKEKEDWKSVASLHEEKAKDLETKYNGLKDSLVREKKIGALTIEAQKHGINPASISDLELLDFEEISVETTSTGKILVSGQDRAIQRLKTLRPHWFTANVPSVNTHTPTANKPLTGIVTMEDLNRAQAQYSKTKSDSDLQIYKDIIFKYKSQGG